MKKRVLSLILTVSMLIAAVPAGGVQNVHASSDNGKNPGLGHVSYGDWEPDFVDFPTHTVNRAGGSGSSANVTDSYYRNTNLPEVRNQGVYGLCWAFTSIGACEAEYIQNNNGGDASGIDMSEGHLGYYAFHRFEDPLGNLAAATMEKANDWYSYGLNSLGAFNTLASWNGAVNDDKLPYSGYSSYVGSRQKAYGEDDYHLENAYVMNKRDRTAVKRAILDYGAVSLGFYADTSIQASDESKLENGRCGYDTTNKSYYRSDMSTSNHEVLIVGWDDNFNKFNASNGFTPKAAGAWICRNSWGAEFGDNGYFYISYEDSSIDSVMVSFDVEPASNFENIYQYDGNFTGAAYYNENADGSRGDITNYIDRKVANVFTAKANQRGSEILKAVSFISYEANGKYTINIYTNLTNASNPESGTRADTITGSYTYAGYHTIKTKEILLQEGQKYSVVIEIKDSNGNNLGVASAYSALGMSNDAQKGRSFYSSERSWIDCYNENPNYALGYLSIKAFTNNEESDSFAISGKISDSVTETSATISWNSVAAADGYNIYIKSKLDDAWEKTGSTSQAAVNGRITYVIEKLTPGSSYIVGVRPYKQEGTGQTEGEWSYRGISQGQLKEDDMITTQIAAPKTVSMLSRTKSSIKIQWNSVEGAATYEAKINGISDSNISVNGTTATVTGLRPGTGLYFEICAVGSGYCARSVKKYTPFFYTYLEKVSGVTKKDAEAGAIMLYWNSVMNASAYGIKNMNTGKIIGIVNNSTFVKIIGSPGDTQKYSVIAYIIDENGRIVSESESLSDAITVTFPKEEKCTHSSLTTKVTKATPAKDGRIDKCCDKCGQIISTTVIPQISSMKLSASGFNYTGKKLTPKITVYDRNNKVVAVVNYTVTYKNNIKPGTATVTVTFKGNYSGTLTGSFSIKPKNTSKLQITSKTKSLVLKWNKAPVVSGYQIQYSTSSGMKNARIVTISKSTTTTTTLKKLKAKKNYYLRIRTYYKAGKTTVYSVWSKVVKKKTK